MLVCAVVFLVRFVPGNVALPRTRRPGRAPGPRDDLEPGSWASQTRPWSWRPSARCRPGLVALEELTPRHAEAIAADPAIRLLFPYQVLQPRGGSDGLGLLSSWPIEDGWTFDYDPPTLSATVTADVDRPMAVVVAHPVPGRARRRPLRVADAMTPRSAMRAIASPPAGRRSAPRGRQAPRARSATSTPSTARSATRSLRPGSIDAQHAVGLGPGTDVAARGARVAALRAAAHRLRVQRQRVGAPEHRPRLHPARQRPLHPARHPGAAVRGREHRSPGPRDRCCRSR